MPILDLPRLHFNGGFSTNVDTANNNNIVQAVNATLVELTGVLAQQPNTAAARKWFTDWASAHPQALRCSWNYWGDHSTTFRAASVSSTATAFGSPSEDDPIKGGSVVLGSAAGTPPVMVDMDPTGSLGSQVFAGGFQVGNQSLGFSAHDPVRMYSRWIIAGGPRNLSVPPSFTRAQAVWQFPIPNAQLTWNGADRSPALAALRQAAESALGVLVQYVMYYTSTGLTMRDLYEDYYSKGKYTQNPAVGLVAGSIGTWKHDDLLSAPNGRCLVGLPTKFRVGADTKTTTITLAPATAIHHREAHVVSINLLATFPEVVKTVTENAGDSGVSDPPRMSDVDEPPESKLAKADLGPMTLKVLTPDGQSHDIADMTSAYSSYASYLKTSGVVDLSYSDSQLGEAIDAGDLFVESGQVGEPVMNELVVRVETDDRATYLESGDSAQIGLAVRERGGPPTADVTVEFTLQTSGAEPPPSGSLDFNNSLTVPAGSTDPTPLTVHGRKAMMGILTFTQGTGMQNPDGYANVRVLPENDYAGIPESQLDFALVYKEVLRYYDYVFPRMSAIIPLDDESAVRENGVAILHRLKHVPFDSPLFMPVTRNMSRGRLQLLERWINKVSSPG